MRWATEAGDLGLGPRVAERLSRRRSAMSMAYVAGVPKPKGCV